jgi:hypothetical protein
MRVSSATKDLSTVRSSRTGASAIYYLLVGGTCGLAWAAGLRGFMTQIVVEDGSTVTWTGTFAWVLAPGLGTGLLLGWAAYLVKVGGPSRARRLVFAPFLFAALLVPPILRLDFEGFLANGIGGGTIGVPAVGVLGAYAIAGARLWGRILCGLLALSPIPVWALTAETIGGASLGLDEPLGLWVALYYWSFLAVLMLGCSIPLHIRLQTD